MKQSGIKVNDKIYFKEEKRPYTIKAFDGRYAICTKPYNPQKTVVYCIVDFKNNIRSTNDYVLNPYDYNKPEDINQSLIDLKNGKYQLSKRHELKLNIDKVHRTIS